MLPDETPTQPIPRVTGTAPLPLLPRLVEEPEPQVHFVPAGRNPLLIPIVATLVLLAFIGGVFVASWNGLVDLPAPLQAEKPRTSPTAPATKKPDPTKSPREITVVGTKPNKQPDTPIESPEATEEPAPEPTPTASEEAPTSPPETSEPTDPPSSPATEAPTSTPPIEPEEPTTTPEEPVTEVPTTPAGPTTDQPTDTGEPTP